MRDIFPISKVKNKSQLIRFEKFSKIQLSQLSAPQEETVQYLSFGHTSTPGFPTQSQTVWFTGFKKHVVPCEIYQKLLFDWSCTRVLFTDVKVRTTLYFRNRYRIEHTPFLYRVSV